MSWVTREGIQEITPYHIFGGVDPQDLEEVYICRAWHSYNYNGSDYLNLLPGKYVPSKGVCSVPFAGNENLFLYLVGHVGLSF